MIRCFTVVLSSAKHFFLTPEYVLFADSFINFLLLPLKLKSIINESLFLILFDCNGIRTHNHLICKRTLNQFDCLVKWLSGCGFMPRCSYLNFRYRTCFEQRTPLHYINCRVGIHSEMGTGFFFAKFFSCHCMKHRNNFLSVFLSVFAVCVFT